MTQPLIVIVGPTAVGKTATALVLAQRLNAEIVSADSRYLYRGLDLGTAKPTLAERAQIPHHLIDVTEPDQPWSLSQYQLEAQKVIAGIHARGRLPLLVGGTGQYVRALIEGWEIPPGNPTGEVRAELERVLASDGIAALADHLRAVDPLSAERVDLRNPRRVIRALEVALTTGESFMTQRRKTPPAWAILQIGLTRPRPQLYARIDARIDEMIRNGLVAEVQALAAHGYAWDLPALSALGYKQIGEHLRGECDLPEAVRRIQRATRQFVRRQANWFKPTDPGIQWFDLEEKDVEEIEAFVTKALSGKH